jgi:TPR repeat protein
MGGSARRHRGKRCRAHVRLASVLLTLVCLLPITSAAPAAEYAEGARAFDRGDYARAISLWRSAAWVSDDVDAQLELGDLYRTDKYVPKDIVEAYVWTYLAVINKPQPSDHLKVLSNSLGAELKRRAEKVLPELFFQMTSAEQREAERRIVYILASQGAEGLYRLGEIYFSCPTGGNVNVPYDRILCRPNVAPAPASVFNDNPVDAYAYFSMAEDLGHKYAATAKKTIWEQLLGCPALVPAPPAPSVGGPTPLAPIPGYSTYCDKIKWAADRMHEFWEPPFEVYPKPYSDESRVDTLKEEALTRIGSIKCSHFQEALRELGFYRGPIDSVCGPGTQKAILSYQASIGGPVTGALLPAQAVRLIRTAAVNGFAASQFTLGYMYFYGYGVPVSYPRARGWFEKAGGQRHPQALYNLGIMYRDGLGVEIDFAQAATYFMASRDAGYPKPDEIRCRLSEVKWPDEGGSKQGGAQQASRDPKVACPAKKGSNE